MSKLRTSPERRRSASRRSSARLSHAHGPSGAPPDETARTERTEPARPGLPDLAAPVERARRATDELVRPLPIRGAAVSGFQRVEQCVIVQPVSLVLAEAL